MVAPLIVLVAHGLDALTFVWGVSLWGISAESNPFARAVYAFGGIGSVLSLKAGGAAVIAWIVARPRWRTGKLLFAAAAGILGAASNLAAVALA